MPWRIFTPPPQQPTAHATHTTTQKKKYASGGGGGDGGHGARGQLWLESMSGLDVHAFEIYTPINNKDTCPHHHPNHTAMGMMCGWSVGVLDWCGKHGDGLMWHG